VVTDYWLLFIAIAKRKIVAKGKTSGKLTKVETIQ
jgi:phosphoribosyl-AMP cyclohydrolase